MASLGNMEIEAMLNMLLNNHISTRWLMRIIKNNNRQQDGGNLREMRGVGNEKGNGGQIQSEKKNTRPHVEEHITEYTDVVYSIL